jgi:hypothetical protein
MRVFELQVNLQKIKQISRCLICLLVLVACAIAGSLCLWECIMYNRLWWKYGV